MWRHHINSFQINPFSATGRIHTSKNRPSLLGQGRMYVQAQFRFYAFVKARPPTWLLSHVSEVSSSLLAACSLGSFSLRKQFFYASHGFCLNGGKQCCGCSQMLHKLVRAVCLMAFFRDDDDQGKEREREREWFRLVEIEGDGKDGRDGLEKETSDGHLMAKMTTLLAAMLWTTTSMFQLTVNARLCRETVGTKERASSRAKHCESAIRRNSKRESCLNDTLEKPLKVKKRNPYRHHHCFFVCSVGRPVKFRRAVSEPKHNCKQWPRRELSLTNRPNTVTLAPPYVRITFFIRWYSNSSLCNNERPTPFFRIWNNIAQNVGHQGGV